MFSYKFFYIHFYIILYYTIYDTLPQVRRNDESRYSPRKCESERHCVLPVVRTDGLDSLSRERRNRERARTEKKREGRVWYALRAAGSHTTGPKERTPGPRRLLHHARQAPRGRGDTPKRRSIAQVTKKHGDIFSSRVPSWSFIPSHLSCNTPLHSAPACVCARSPTADTCVRMRIQ